MVLGGGDPRKSMDERAEEIALLGGEWRRLGLEQVGVCRLAAHVSPLARMAVAGSGTLIPRSWQTASHDA